MSLTEKFQEFEILTDRKKQQSFFFVEGDLQNKISLNYVKLNI